MNEVTDKDFEEFRDSVRPEQDVITPDGKSNGDYYIAVPEYIARMNGDNSDCGDQNGGEIIDISGSKDAVTVVYHIEDYVTEDGLRIAGNFTAHGRLVKDDEGFVWFQIESIEDV